MKLYNTFLLEKLGKHKIDILNLVINYLYKKTPYIYSPYFEEFEIKKQNSKPLTGKLYLVTNNENDITKAIRFNFNNARVVSIDLWEKFEFILEDNVKKMYNKPNWELFVNGSLITKLDEILEFVNGDFKKLKENNNNPIIVDESPEEEVESKTYDFENKGYDIDMFKAISLYTEQIVKNHNSNSLIISGDPGMGKTTDVVMKLKELNVDYIRIAGSMSASGLYEMLYKNRFKLIVLDDMDDALKKEEQIRILKAVLDTGKERIVSRHMKGYFDSVEFDMNDAKMEQEYLKTKILPNQFEFVGQMIFITNIDGEKLDNNLVSRSIHLDIKPTPTQVQTRIKSIMPFMIPEIPLYVKEDTLNFMNELLNVYIEKHQLNLRTFWHALNLRYSNEQLIKNNGMEIPRWKGLVKLYLVKKRKRKDIIKED